MEKRTFSGRIWPDWGNTTRADFAGLGSIAHGRVTFSGRAYSHSSKFDGKPAYDCCNWLERPCKIVFRDKICNCTHVFGVGLFINNTQIC